VFPLYPCQSSAVGAPARLHIEICSAGKDLRPNLSLQAGVSQNVAPFVGVHKSHPALIGAKCWAGAAAKARRERADWAEAVGGEVQAPVPIGKHCALPARAELTAAVAHPANRVEVAGESLRRLRGARGHQGRLAALGLAPHQALTTSWHPLHVRKAYPPLDELGCDRRWP